MPEITPPKILLSCTSAQWFSHQTRSTEAAKHYRNNSFDWVYVDALHTKQAALADLDAWYPKIRRGGLVSGDDYGDMFDTEYFPVSRSFGKGSRIIGTTAQRFEWGVISAVQQFARDHGAVLHVTWLNDCYNFPAWWFVKP